MPGDPLRAKWISETFLKDAFLVNDVRGMLAYTGFFNNKKITVMGHGMGIPSMGIYSYELYKFYDVDTILRIGSAGGYAKNVHIGDVLIAKDTLSYSLYADDIGVDVKDNILLATDSLVKLAELTAKELSVKINACRVFCSDSFYNKYTLEENIKRSNNASAVEMESFALYANALKLNKKALTLLTCSDSFVNEGNMTTAERQNSFNDMVNLALNIANKLL
jgi:purine-nucleoside phosphorylase